MFTPHCGLRGGCVSSFVCEGWPQRRPWTSRERGHRALEVPPLPVPNVPFGRVGRYTQVESSTWGVRLLSAVVIGRGHETQEPVERRQVADQAADPQPAGEQLGEDRPGVGVEDVGEAPPARRNIVNCTKVALSHSTARSTG